ncbi:hypothetical protein ACU8V3_03340 [Cobetia marina]
MASPLELAAECQVVVLVVVNADQVEQVLFGAQGEGGWPSDSRRVAW